MPSRRKHKRTRRASGMAPKAPVFRRAYSGSLKTAGGANDLIDEAISIWQKRSEKQLTREDGREIVENVMGFFSILQEWRFAELAAQSKKTKQGGASGKVEAIRDEAESELTNIG